MCGVTEESKTLLLHHHRSDNKIVGAEQNAGCKTLHFDICILHQAAFLGNALKATFLSLMTFKINLSAVEYKK